MPPIRRASLQRECICHKNWQIQSSCEVKAAGEQISSAGFDVKGWHKADVPATAVGALIIDKTYPDPFWANNLQS